MRGRKVLRGFVAEAVAAPVGPELMAAGKHACVAQVDSTRPAADELAAALNTAPRAASTLVGLVRRVETTLPAACDALADGRLELTRLRVVDQVVRDLPAAARRRSRPTACTPTTPPAPRSAGSPSGR